MAIRTFTATPIYEGRVQLLLDPANPNVMKFEEVNQPDYYYQEYFYQTQYTILKSRGLARRTIDALKLWDSPEFGGGDAQQKKSFSITGALAGTAGWVKGLFSSPPAEPSHAGRGGNRQAVAAHRRVPWRPHGQPDPQQQPRRRAIRVVEPRDGCRGREHAWRSSTSSRTSSTSSSPPKEASDWLGEQLAVERKKLEASEQALQRYREKGDAVALEDRQNIVVQRLADLNAAYTQARTDRFEKEALYNQLKSLQNDRAALDTFPAILSNTFIQQLKSQLADLQRQQAQMARAARREAPRDDQAELGHREHRGEAAGRTGEGRAVGAQRVPVGPVAGAEPGRANSKPRRPTRWR